MAAVVALVQINAQRTGSESPIATGATTAFGLAQAGISAAIGGAHSLGSNVASLPSLASENAKLRSQNVALIEENARLHELAEAYAAETAARPLVELYRGVEARVIGFPPEDESRSVTIDKGTQSGIHRDDGVISPDGVVGRVASAGPFTSTVVLITDYTSRIPAIVRRGRWWGIARGNVGSVRLEFVPQDAPMKVGDVVVTGEGRSFHSGVPIGTVLSIERGDATLYQTAVLKPSVDLGALDRVIVVPH